jgi:hypothetical protein
MSPCHLLLAGLIPTLKPTLELIPDVRRANDCEARSPTTSSSLARLRRPRLVVPAGTERAATKPLKTDPGRRTVRLRLAARILGAWAVVAMSACGEVPVEDATDANGVIDTTRPGPLMRPGQDCGRCHSATSTGDVGPTWTAAGTIFADPQADSLAGVEGVLVRLTDSEGRTRETTTNQVGNFWFDAELAPPLQVELVHNGVVTRMGSPAPSGYCAACHTAVNPLGPPGRVFVPGAR